MPRCTRCQLVLFQNYYIRHTWTLAEMVSDAVTDDSPSYDHDLRMLG